MQAPLRRRRKKILAVRRLPITFRTAITLSLLCHMVAFLIVGGLLDFFVETDEPPAPQVFELALGKVGEREETTALPAKHAGALPPPRSPTNREQAQSPHHPAALNRDERHSSINEAPMAETITDAEIPAVQHGDTPAEVTPPRAAPIQLPAAVSPRLRTTRVDNAALVPLKLPVSTSHRKEIFKKLMQFVSKPKNLAALDSSFFWEKNGQRFMVQMQHQPASSASELDELLITVSTVEGGDTLASQVRMRRLAFSSFAQFIDYWDPHVAVHDDEFDGRFHSNSSLVISSSHGIQPKFRGKVTTADYSISRGDLYASLDSRAVFLAGIETGADPIPLPKVFLDLASDTGFTSGRTSLFTEETWITFHRDGTYTWRTASAPEIEQRAVLSAEADCLVGRGKAKLHLKGVVNGTLIVYCENKIIIDGDLRYAQPPEQFPGADDFLGLVSRRDVEIAPPSVTGPGDLRIDAAILAKGRFYVTNIYSRQRGTLYIYGSLSAGSISATEPRYATRIRYDKRFDNMRPPNFPMTSRYEIVDWDAQWKVNAKGWNDSKKFD